MWRVYFVSALIAGVTGSSAAFVTVHLMKPAVSHPETVTLEGEEFVNLGQSKVINFKVPFASPPHLTFLDGTLEYRATDEKADSFTLHRFAQDPDQSGKVKWKAEGQPAK